MTFRTPLAFSALLILFSGCGSANEAPAEDTAGSGGADVGGSGALAGGISTGGNGSSTGGTSNAGGSSSTGGTSNAGGSSSTGGSLNAGGASTGGTTNTGDGGLVTFTPPMCAPGSSKALPATAPTLTVGTFVNISPPGVPFNSTAASITQGMTIDPCNPATIYVCVGDAQAGLYRSTDGGGTWTRIQYGGGFPVRVAVDPADPLHIYVGDGVRGGNNGFFVTTDGGKTWKIPQAFTDFAKTNGSFDVYHVEPDPTDFKHVLVSFHSGWKGETENGVIESLDGGNTWRRAGLPGAGANEGTDVYMLYEPSLKIGNNKTWLFATQGNGHWRTTDAGTTWKKVSDIVMEHGGGTKYYKADGTLYISSNRGILKSTDNGQSFTQIGPANGYLSMIGDGTHLYAGAHFNARFQTALESADTAWSNFNAQMFDEGPFEMAIDHANGILYSAQVRSGVYALKLK